MQNIVLIQYPIVPIIHLIPTIQPIPSNQK